MIDRRWLKAHAKELLAYIVDEQMTDDEVWQWMEKHYQESFEREDAEAMREYMGDVVDG